MNIAMALLLAFAQESDCMGTCPNPAELMHPQSMDHTHGGNCRTCSDVIDRCFVLCDGCAKDACRVCGGKTGTGKVVKVEQTWSGGDSKIDKPEFLRITDEKAWSELWKRHAGQGAPEVDFKESMIIAVLRGAILESAATDLVGVREFEGRIVLAVRWSHPRCGNEPAITDYLFVKLPRSAKKIQIVFLERGIPKQYEVLAEFKAF